jgi:membrane-anchored protein YejM (alkaline phosphatase superfamily)
MKILSYVFSFGVMVSFGLWYYFRSKHDEDYRKMWSRMINVFFLLFLIAEIIMYILEV